MEAKEWSKWKEYRQGLCYATNYAIPNRWIYSAAAAALDRRNGRVLQNLRKRRIAAGTAKK